MQHIARIAAWAIFALALSYLALFLYSYPRLHEKRLTESAVSRIEAKRLTAADLVGAQLPPGPDHYENDSTVRGIDSNGNGIRDDVELAIFAAYPTSSAVRAGELQYALALQGMLTEVSDNATWRAAQVEEDRGYQCIAAAYPKSDLQQYLQSVAARAGEVEALQFDTPARVAARQSLARFATSYAAPTGAFCDIDQSAL